MEPITLLKREILLLINKEDLEDNKELYLEIEKLLDKNFNFKANPTFIEQLWEEVKEVNDSLLLDPYISDFRESGIDTGLSERKFNQYYESKEVAKQLTNSDRWIGWTYWYGGGKHGEPDNMDWMEDCYLLDMEIVMKPVIEFKQLETGVV